MELLTLLLLLKRKNQVVEVKAKRKMAMGSLQQQLLITAAVLLPIIMPIRGIVQRVHTRMNHYIWYVPYVVRQMLLLSPLQLDLINRGEVLVVLVVDMD